MAHLSPQTQQRFLGRAMDPQEVLTVTLHLREYASCRERLTVLRSGVTGSLVEQILAEAPIEDHPSQDLLAAFVDNDLAQADRTVVENHLATCEICPGIVTDLQSFREELRELTTKEYTPFRENRTWPSQKAPGWTNWNFTQLMAFGATVATAALLILLVFVPIKFSSLPTIRLTNAWQRVSRPIHGGGSRS
jgi:hypothetical protein